jgi:hypothetical protein
VEKLQREGVHEGRAAEEDPFEIHGFGGDEFGNTTGEFGDSLQNSGHHSKPRNNLEQLANLLIKAIYESPEQSQQKGSSGHKLQSFDYQMMLFHVLQASSSETDKQGGVSVK